MVTPKSVVIWLSIRQHYAQALAGLDFVVVIEPALYSHISIPVSEFGLQKLTLWHLHALVWNVAAARCSGWSNSSMLPGNSLIPLVPSQVGARHRMVTELDRVCWYLRKRPINAYRIGLTKRDWRRKSLCAPSHDSTRASCGPVNVSCCSVR